MDVREKIALFPHSPGVYRYYDSEGTVIYVGKAKDLHKRVAQYFVAPERLNAKTRVLVSKIADAQYSVVDSEADALLLENNLIKQYKPKYNILLKDSKTYPWICVTDEPFPRVFITRRVTKGARYFGPYSSARHAHALVDFFGSAYPLRSCKYKIDSEAILRHKYRPCLDFHIGKCKGPCIGAYSQEEYARDIEEIVRILKGDTAALIREYTARMNQAAAELDFETAQECKEKLDVLNEHYSKSVIQAARDVDADVFSLDFDQYFDDGKGVDSESLRSAHPSHFVGPSRSCGHGRPQVSIHLTSPPPVYQKKAKNKQDYALARRRERIIIAPTTARYARISRVCTASLGHIPISGRSIERPQMPRPKSINNAITPHLYGIL